MKTKLTNIWQRIKRFFTKYGIDAVIAIIFWWSPSWLAIFIPALRPTALWWIGLLAMPFPPMWAIVPLTAVFIHWLRKKIWQLILYIRDQLDKVQMQNQMAAYFTRDEMRLILDKGKHMYKIKSEDKARFNKEQDDKRHELITKNWETSLEETK